MSLTAVSKPEVTMFCLTWCRSMIIIMQIFTGYKDGKQLARAALPLPVSGVVIMTTGATAIAI